MRSENLAVAALRSRGYSPFAPMSYERRRYCGHAAAVQTPVLPGYLFCRFEGKRKLPILSSPAVKYIASFGGVPAIIPDEEIEGVSRAVAAGGRAHDYLSTGQQVRVESGPLVGLEGILDRQGRKDRLVASIRVLQRAGGTERSSWP